ncbi:hypothetical protein C8R47DRAFT_974563 [Mycena vitilis]|nr:hypothetical protein C8R47DRAFT_974563 [Mycena vitilis]
MASPTYSSYCGWSPTTHVERRRPVHPASQVYPDCHSLALRQLVHLAVSRRVVAYIVHCVFHTVQHALAQHLKFTPSHSLRRFTQFVENVLCLAEIRAPTVLVALAYIARARPHLSIATAEWALERVFLGALIVASKYTHDCAIRNAEWALCTGLFGKGDIGRIEREFLEVLDWELGVREFDLLAHREGFLAGVSTHGGKQPTLFRHCRGRRRTALRHRGCRRRPSRNKAT